MSARIWFSCSVCVQSVPCLLCWQLFPRASSSVCLPCHQRGRQQCQHREQNPTLWSPDKVRLMLCIFKSCPCDVTRFMYAVHCRPVIGSVDFWTVWVSNPPLRSCWGNLLWNEGGWPHALSGGLVGRSSSVSRLKRLRLETTTNSVDIVPKCQDGTAEAFKIAH